MIIQCKKLAEEWLSDLGTRVRALSRSPRLGILLIGDDPGSTRYVQQKESAGKTIGVAVNVAHIAASVSQQEARNSLVKLEKSVDGLIIQMPLPKQLGAHELLDAVPANKDVDGLSAASLAALHRNCEGFVPATVRGILYLLERREISVSGKHVVIIGAGQLVGRPAAFALINRGATVSVVDVSESAPERLLSQADIVISATGSPGTAIAGIRKGTLVLDAGFSFVAGKVVGDLDTKELDALGAVVTPVPGGLGRLTVPALFDNLLQVIEA